MEWFEAIEVISPHVVQISTPVGSGTGWLVSTSSVSTVCAIATAAHVVDHAHSWQEPIRVTHALSGKSILLRNEDRAIFLDPEVDTAGIIMHPGDLPLPKETLTITPKDKYMKPGVEIGWLGFPAIRNAGLCFFSGHISNYIQETSSYLVDGVAINGVSGGPAFWRFGEKAPHCVGIVSAYIPNISTGEVLPGVAVLRDVRNFHDIADKLKSIDAAKEKESPPIPPVLPKQEPPKTSRK